MSRRERESQRKEEKAESLSRVTYPLFSREIAAQGSSSRVFHRNQLYLLRQEIKQAKKDGNPERTAQLKAQKQEFLQLRKQARHETRQVRAVLREQLKEHRAHRKGREYLANEDVCMPADPWAARLPNMHKLFPASDTKLKEKIHSEVGALLSSSDPDSLPKLVDLIDSYMSAAHPQAMVIDFCLLEALISAIGAFFTNMLEALSKNEDLFSKAVLESYHHDLFEKVVLLSGNLQKWKLRMHVFLPENFTVSQEEIHSHRNHFASRIMHGGFTHEIYEPVVNPQEEGALKLHKYIYDPLVAEQGARVFNIEPVGEVHLKKVHEGTVCAGQSYYMHTSVLHAVSGLYGCTVTVVLNAPQTIPTSCFATYQPWEDETFVRTRFTDEELKSQIDKVMLLVNNNSKHENGVNANSGDINNNTNDDYTKKLAFARGELRKD